MTTSNEIDIHSQGVLLKNARIACGLSSEAAAKMARVRLLRLVRIEMGETQIGPAELERLASLYRVDPEDWERRGLVPRLPTRFDVEAQTLTVGPDMIRLTSGPDRVDRLFADLAHLLRRLRGLKPEDPVHLRAMEVPILAELTLGVGRTELQQILMQRLGLPQDRANAVALDLSIGSRAIALSRTDRDLN